MSYIQNYQNDQQNNSFNQSMCYYLKAGKPVQCSGQITEIINGVENKKQCPVILTNYGDGRETDRPKNGGLHCNKCHRIYNREKQRQLREKKRQEEKDKQNVNGMITPGYGMMNQGVGGMIHQNFNGMMHQNVNGMITPGYGSRHANLDGMMPPGYSKDFSTVITDSVEISESDEYEKIKELKDENKQLKEKIENLEARLSILESSLLNYVDVKNIVEKMFKDNFSREDDD